MVSTGILEIKTTHRIGNYFDKATCFSLANCLKVKQKLVKVFIKNKPITSVEFSIMEVWEVLVSWFLVFGFGLFVCLF